MGMRSFWKKKNKQFQVFSFTISKRLLDEEGIRTALYLEGFSQNIFFNHNNKINENSQCWNKPSHDNLLHVKQLSKIVTTLLETYVSPYCDCGGCVDRENWIALVYNGKGTIKMNQVKKWSDFTFMISSFQEFSWVWFNFLVWDFCKCLNTSEKTTCQTVWCKWC